MRAHGLLSELPDPARAEHVCWVYADDTEFDIAVRRFVAAGLARGDRLLCVGERAIEAVQGGLAPLDDVDALLAGGALQLLTTADAFAATGEFSADRQSAFYDSATRRAVDDGYRGLRVVAEVSPLAADAGRRPELVRWEHLADQYVASGAGMTALCAYRGGLPPEALSDVASVHPLAVAPESAAPFRVFFDDDRIVLAGSVDTFGADRLARVLAASPTGGGPVVLDVSPLEFVDVAGCRALALWARDLGARSAPPEIRGASGLLQRMWQILTLDRVAPITFVEQTP